MTFRFNAIPIDIHLYESTENTIVKITKCNCIFATKLFSLIHCPSATSRNSTCNQFCFLFRFRFGFFVLRLWVHQRVERVSCVIVSITHIKWIILSWVFLLSLQPLKSIDRCFCLLSLHSNERLNYSFLFENDVARTHFIRTWGEPNDRMKKKNDDNEWRSNARTVDHHH